MLGKFWAEAPNATSSEYIGDLKYTPCSPHYTSTFDITLVFLAYLIVSIQEVAYIH